MEWRSGSRQLKPPKRFANLRHALVELTLFNRRADGAVAPARVSIVVDLEDPAEFDEVDDCFERYVSEDADPSRLNAFASATRSLATTSSYVDALHGYVIGLLLKNGETVGGLGRDGYRAKLQRAYDTLRNHPDRRLARAAAAVIRFNLNTFDPGQPLSGHPRLDLCTHDLMALGHPMAETPSVDLEIVGTHGCPTDDATEVLLAQHADLADNPRVALATLQTFARSSPTTREDAAKARALIISTPTGRASVHARDAAQALMHDAAFGAHAHRVLQDVRP